MKKLLAIVVLTGATMLCLSANRSGEVLASPSALAAPPSAVYVLSEDGEESESGQGYLGVQVNRLSRSLRGHFGVPDDLGVLVAEVEPGTPADAAGLQAGDVVIRLDGEPIATPGELTRAILARPGEWVEVEVYRDGSPLLLSATLGQRQATLEWGGDMAELEQVGQRIAEAFEKVDWEGFASQFEEQFEEHGEDWEQFGEELGARFSEAMENQDWESWGEFWEDFGERWAEWGEDQGEKWAQWGEEHGEHWAEWGEDQGAKWAEWGEHFAETWAERGEDWAELGEELGETIGQSFESIDWDELGAMIERVMDNVSRAIEDASDR